MCLFVSIVVCQHVLARVIVCTCFSTCPNACIFVVLVPLFVFIYFGVRGCVYLLNTFPNVNACVIMCTKFSVCMSA
jgi:hypothetical protein